MRTADDYLSLNYPISIFKDDEGGYIAEVDELSGCLAGGGTPGEAFDNACEAMRSWIESRLKAGLQVPEPRTEVEFSGKVLLRMPRWLHRRLSQQARTESTSLNQYIVSILAERCGAEQTLASMPNLGTNWVLNSNWQPEQFALLNMGSTFPIPRGLSFGRVVQDYARLLGTDYRTQPTVSANDTKTSPVSVRDQLVA